MRRPTTGIRPRSLGLALAAVLAALLALAVAPRRAAAQPACVGGTVASYLALGPAGCRIADVRFRDFSAEFAQRRSGFTDLDPALATLTPLDHGGGLVGFRLAFSPPLNAFSSAAAGLNCSGNVCFFADLATLSGSVTASAIGRDVIRAIGFGDFDVTAARTGAWNAFGSATLTMQSSATQISQEWLAGSPPACVVEGVPVPCANPLLTALGPGVPSERIFLHASAGVSSFSFFAGDPAPSGSATTHFTGVDFLVFASPVPEPASVVLVASGLLGVGVARWRRRSRVRGG